MVVLGGGRFLMNEVPHVPRESTFVRVLKQGIAGGVPREQKMLKGHVPRVRYHQVH